MDGALVGAGSLGPSFLGPSTVNWSQKIERRGVLVLLNIGV